MKHAHTHHHAAKKPAPAAEAPVTAAAPAPASKDEFVREAAYFYYEQRGRVGGHELDDWLKAEAEFERLDAAPSGDAADTGH
jgi:hypothetical protein